MAAPASTNQETEIHRRAEELAASAPQLGRAQLDKLAALIGGKR